MRRLARENVFKLVFEYTFYGAPNEGTLNLLLEDGDLTDDDRIYIRDTYVGVLAQEQELKAIIEKHLEGYSLGRVYRPDLTVLMLAVFELKEKKVPQAVVINEAVGLAKKYGTDKSGKFVNGVLAKIASDFQ